MISNIGLLKGIPSNIYISTQNITVSRIGEIVLLEKDGSYGEARNPWELLLTADDWEYSHGAYCRRNFGKIGSNDSILEITADKYNLEDIASKTAGTRESLCLAFVQGDKDNLQASIFRNSTLCGIETMSDGVCVVLDIQNCEMVYGR